MGNENGRMLSPEEMRNREIGLMDGEMRRKLNTRASKYNLKLVIKGERNTGKSSFFSRLQGKPFSPDYSPTPEIQISHINWNYKSTDDIVDVEVWDVVDVAQVKKKTTGTLSTQHHQVQQQPETNEYTPPTANDISEQIKKGQSGGSFKLHSLDAQTIDVMKNVSAVIFMVNPQKKWTFQYVEKELIKIPEEVYVLMIFNYRDQGDYSKIISRSEIDGLCESRPNMYHIDASMLNAYGLKTIVSFFNVPFLHMQRNAILQQLDRNKIEFDLAMEEVSLLIADQSYNEHVKRLEQVRIEREQQQQQQQQQQVSPLQSNNTQVKSISGSSSTSTTQINTTTPTTTTPNSTSPPPTQQTVQNTGSGGFFSRIFGGSKTTTPTSTPNVISPPITSTTNAISKQLPQQQQQQNQPQIKLPPKKIESVDDYDPSEGAEDSFYDDDDKPKSSAVSFIKNVMGSGKKDSDKKPETFGDDDDDDGFNPLVAKNEGDDSSDDEDVQVFNIKGKPTVVSTKQPEKKQPATTPNKTTTITIPEKKIQSSPAPAPAPIKSSTPTSKPNAKPIITKDESFGNSDDEYNDDNNPFVTKDQDIDSDDDNEFVTPTKKTTSITASKSPSISTPSNKSTPKQTVASSPKQSTTPSPAKLSTSPALSTSPKSPTTTINTKTTPVVSAKPSSTPTSNKSTTPKPSTSQSKPKKPVVIKFNDDEESDTENSLVAKDEGADSSDDEDVQVFTPVTSKTKSKSTPSSASKPLKTTPVAPVPSTPSSIQSADDFVPTSDDVDDWLDD